MTAMAIKADKYTIETATKMAWLAGDVALRSSIKLGLWQHLPDSERDNIARGLRYVRFLLNEDPSLSALIDELEEN